MIYKRLRPLLLAVNLGLLPINACTAASGAPYDGVYPQHEPYGTGVGAMPGRVVWAYDPASVDWDGSGYWWKLNNFDEDAVADESAPIIWSHEFSGRANYLPTCVTEAEYIINLANLKGHSYGVTLCGKNHFGSFINGNMMRPSEGANLHQWLTRNEMGIYSPLADLMANADLGGKAVLYMLDALICAPSEGASITGDNSRWQQAPFNGGYTASVFVSQDPVAIDSVGADFLMNEPAVTGRDGALRDNPTVENYLHEAGLVSAAPSVTVYTDSQGNAVVNLGVHEHCNNSVQKQYSRNLGGNEGIELILLP